jgi:hypothetical protein
MMNKKYFLVPVMLLLSLAAVLAIPPIPTEFYGRATWYDQNSTPLPVGTSITLYSGNISCGTFSIVNAGYYGVASCLGDDNYTLLDEGADIGQNIIFQIGTDTAQAFGDTVWYAEDYHMVNITPPPRCGNNHCELTESCTYCIQDCGLCPNATVGNGTGGVGGNGTGGGTGGGGSAPAGGGGGGGGGGGTGSNEFTGGGGYKQLNGTMCLEDWYCTEWKPEVCPVEGVQKRVCSDKNNCGTLGNKPTTNQSCSYIGTCFDILKNQDETDIDCGGTKCEPCDLYKKCIFDLDCKSGFCDPLENVCMEPTCVDNFKNQEEEEVDCGGPCPPCERPSIERPSTIARFLVVGCGSFPWLFILVSSIITLLLYIIGKAKIKKQKASKAFRKLTKLEQLKREYEAERNLSAFVLIVILLEIAISLYLYYLCEITFWVILMLLVILPLIIAVWIKYYVYDEKRKTEKIKKLIVRHEDYIRYLIDLEKQELMKLEKNLFLKLNSEVEYSKLDIKLALMLKDIRFLIEELLTTTETMPFEAENTLADSITMLEDYKSAMEGSETLTYLYHSLKLVERIHRDILGQYKKLLEEIEIVKDLELGIKPAEQVVEESSSKEEDKKEEAVEEKKSEENKEEIVVEVKK